MCLLFPVPLILSSKKPMDPAHDALDTALPVHVQGMWQPRRNAASLLRVRGSLLLCGCLKRVAEYGDRQLVMGLIVLDTEANNRQDKCWRVITTSSSAQM